MFHKLKILLIFICTIPCCAQSVLIQSFDGISWEVEFDIRDHTALPMIKVPRGILSERQEESQDQLDTYFNTGLLASLRERTLDCDELLLEYPHILADLISFYVDPLIDRNLAFVFPDLTLKNIPFFWMKQGTYFEALNDNWTLYAWSLFMERNLDHIKRQKLPIIIYHIDDHTDMMAPLVHDDSGLKTLVNNENIQVHEPQSIQNAINLGCIPIGAFMTVFLYQYQDIPISVRHLSKRQTSPLNQRHSISYSTGKDLLFSRNQIKSSIIEHDGSSHSYTLVDDIDAFLKDDSSEEAIRLLHIDMDYFNDRYDGDSNWGQRNRIYDPEREEVISSIINHVRRLSQIKWDHTSVAYSPGFFPSEFWGTSSQILHQSFLKTQGQ
jgi:hypothetical protein